MLVFTLSVALQEVCFFREPGSPVTAAACLHLLANQANLSNGISVVDATISHLNDPACRYKSSKWEKNLWTAVKTRPFTRP
jgi:hypothetical protein